VPLKPPTTDPNGAFPSDFRYSPLEYVRSLFVGFYQGLFAAAPVGMYHWNEDDELSQIYISDESPVKATNIGQRPAISFSRGPVSFFSLGLDDMLETDVRTGSKTKSVLIPGIMTVNCSSRVSLESERIAFICAEQLWLHRELLMKAGFFEIGRNAQVSAPSAAGSIVQSDAADEWYVTTVPCPFQFYRTSMVTPLGAKIVRELALNLRTRLLPVNKQYTRIGGHCGAMENGGADLPVGVRGCPPPAFAPQASDVYGGTPRPGELPRVLETQPHPLNPAQTVVVRGVRPNCPAVRPPGMGGRSIPITTPSVEESCGAQADDHIDLRTVKV
jgi:hypothetical protein